MHSSRWDSRGSRRRCWALRSRRGKKLRTFVIAMRWSSAALHWVRGHCPPCSQLPGGRYGDLPITAAGFSVEPPDSVTPLLALNSAFHIDYARCWCSAGGGTPAVREMPCSDRTGETTSAAGDYPNKLVQASGPIATSDPRECHGDAAALGVRYGECTGTVFGGAQSASRVGLVVIHHGAVDHLERNRRTAAHVSTLYWHGNHRVGARIAGSIISLCSDDAVK